MKRLLKNSLLVAVMMATFSTFAKTTDFSLRVVREEGKTISFVLNDAKSVSLELKNDAGVIVYSENMVSGTNSFINRSYDLSYLPDGTYFLEAETATKVITHKIIVQDEISMEKEAISEIYKPVVFTKDNNVMLQILDINESPVTIAIYDINSNLIYEETYKGELDFSKKFSLKSFNNSNYTFVINYDNKSFTKNVRF